MSDRLFGYSEIKYRTSNIEHRTSQSQQRGLETCPPSGVRGLLVRGLEACAPLEGSRFIGSRFGSLCAFGGFEV